MTFFLPCEDAAAQIPALTPILRNPSDIAGVRFLDEGTTVLIDDNTVIRTS
jgi:hypothetical protein